MKKLILIATGFVFLAGGSYFLANSWGAPQAPAEEAPHRVGLIDITHVLKNYTKLKELEEDLAAQAKEEQTKLNAKVKRIKDLQEEMKELTEGSPEFASRESKLNKLVSEVETENKMLQRQFQQKQAKMVHQVYLEIYDAVEKFCDRYKFTVVVKFNRIDLSSTDPAKVNQLISQPVLYHRVRDDLTDGVLKYLNERYQPTAGTEVKPVTDSKPPKKDKNLKPAGGAKD